jgi:hypothetical protein
MQRIGRDDLWLMAVGRPISTTITAELAPTCAATGPDVAMPAHHDAPVDDLWRAIKPISEALKNENPSIVMVEKLP